MHMALSFSKTLFLKPRKVWSYVWVLTTVQNQEPFVVAVAILVTRRVVPEGSLCNISKCMDGKGVNKGNKAFPALLGDDE